MKSLRSIVVISAFGVLVCAGLHAQTVALRATIPFDFTAGQASMPAGEYEITGSGPAIAVRKLEGKAANAFVMTIGTAGPVSTPSTGVGRLEFHRYGDTYFLAEIWNGSSASGRKVPQTNVEKEVAKRVGSAEAIILASKR